MCHPFTQHALDDEITNIVSANGAYLHTSDGRHLIDAISSWWVVTHGHCHPNIVRAIREQVGKLNQIIFAGYTHDPAEKLARRLLRLASPGLKLVFFSDSGSTSMEVALKMALGYWKNIGKRRTRIIVCSIRTTATQLGRCRLARAASSTRPISLCCSMSR